MTTAQLIAMVGPVLVFLAKVVLDKLGVDYPDDDDFDTRRRR